MKNFSLISLLTIGIAYGADQQDLTLQTEALVPMQTQVESQSPTETIQNQEETFCRQKILKKIFENMIPEDQVKLILPQIITSPIDLRAPRLSLHEKYVIVTFYPVDMWPRGLANTIRGASRVQDDLFLKGILYEYGFFLPKNLIKARKILGSLTGYKKYAAYHLALSYQKENPKYLKYLKIAAEKGHSDAQRVYGAMYYKGKLMPQNFKKAARWFRLAANAGHPDAQCMLGIMYFQGQGVIQDRTESRKFFTTAARQGNSHGQLIYGQFCYEDGNFHEASQWFHLAAAQQNPEAMYCLGVLYQKGQGVVQNNLTAAEYFSLAAQQGYQQASILCGQTYALLGRNYLYGQKGVEFNGEEALKYFHLAAEHHNSSAQKKLGDIYFEGKITSVDREKAAKYYELAAMQGNADAQNNLAIMYLKGDGVAKSDENALRWFRAAAEQGLKNGISGLGVMYGNGLGGLNKNNKIANKLLELSRNNNLRDVFMYFGRMYELGLGNVCADQSKAAAFYAKANAPLPGR